jgi:hypothetical protein
VCTSRCTSTCAWVPEESVQEALKPTTLRVQLTGTVRSTLLVRRFRLYRKVGRGVIAEPREGCLRPIRPLARLRPGQLEQAGDLPYRPRPSSSKDCIEDENEGAPFPAVGENARRYDALFTTGEDARLQITFVASFVLSFAGGARFGRR